MRLMPGGQAPSSLPGNSLNDLQILLAPDRGRPVQWLPTLCRSPASPFWRHRWQAIFGNFGSDQSRHTKSKIPRPMTLDEVDWVNTMHTKANRNNCRLDPRVIHRIAPRCDFGCASFDFLSKSTEAERDSGVSVIADFSTKIGDITFGILLTANERELIDLEGRRNNYSVKSAVIRVTSFTGPGDMRLYLNGGPGPTPITLSGPGDYLLPIPVFTGEAAGIPVTRITIDFLGRSADFAVTLDEITLIPEPSCSGLLLAGGLLVARMRGRQRTPGF